MPLTKPTTQDVAELLVIRSITRGGQYADDFNDQTTPNAASAQKFIDKAHDFVFGKLGDPEDWRVPADDVADYEAEATRLIELYAAMLIELGLYADQVRSGQSPYPELKKLFDESLNGLLVNLGLPGTTTAGGQTEERPAPADWGFPQTSIGDGVMP
jgi:hypothetical protein